jgi:ADP-heptose:LPS heptosyltransferase
LEIRIFGKSYKSLRFFLYIYSCLISKLSHLLNKKKSYEDYNNILIFRVDFLGDAVLNTALISAVRSTFPNAKFTLVSEKHVADIFNNDSNIDCTIGIDKKVRLRDGLQLIGMLLKNKYDLVLDVTSRWWTIIYGTMMAFNTRRYDRDSLMILSALRKNYLLFSGHYERENKREHDVIRALRVIEDLYDIKNIPELYFPLPDYIDEKFAKVAKEYNLKSKEYFIAAPGAQWEVRRWAIDRFADAAKKISEIYNLQIVITGIASESELCHRLNHLLSGRAADLSGKLNIYEFFSVINNSRLLVGNDSGPAHIAAGLKIPVVAIMGTADVEVFKPWGQNVRICYREVLCGPCYAGKCRMPQNICLQPVTVDEVVTAARDLIDSIED